MGAAADPDELRQLLVSAPGPGALCQQDCPALLLLPKLRGSPHLALDVLLGFPRLCFGLCEASRGRQLNTKALSPALQFC